MKTIKTFDELKDLLKDDHKKSKEIDQEIEKIQQKRVLFIAPVVVLLMFIGIYFLVKDLLLLSFLSFVIIQLISTVEQLNDNINLKRLTKKYLTNVQAKNSYRYVVNLLFILIIFLLFKYIQ